MSSFMRCSSNSGLQIYSMITSGMTMLCFYKAAVSCIGNNRLWFSEPFSQGVDCRQSHYTK